MADVVEFLEQFAPAYLAEDWDNVGLLVGDLDEPLRRIMTCLTLTPESVAEAIEGQAELVVSHHPLPFRPLKRITNDSLPGQLLLKLIRAGVAVHSPHTAFDSTSRGINQRLAEGLKLSDIQPLSPLPTCPDGLGAGRWGQVSGSVTLAKMARRLKQFLAIDQLQAVGSLESVIEKAAVACGSAGQFLGPAAQRGCQLLVTGETNFHTCLEAEARGVCLLLPGHYASERFAVERLAEVLDDAFPPLTVWASRQEADPVQFV